MASAPHGAIYWNAFYPGTMQLPATSAYPAHIDGVHCVAIIVGHLRPVVVTDFSNDFTITKHKSRRHLHLKRPIPWKPKDTISVDFNARGNPEFQRAMWTKNHLYRAYRKESFTEITVGVECQSESDELRQEADFFYRVVDRLLELYRAATIDPSAIRYSHLQRNRPTVRGAYIAYDEQAKLPSPQERILARIPGEFPILKQFSILEYAENAVLLEIDEHSIAERVGYHMAIGTRVSDSQNALLDCFALLNQNKNYRFAVIDAFSVAEVEAFDLTFDACQADSVLNDRYQKTLAKNGRVTIKEIINSYLPQVLEVQMAKWPKLIGDLDRARKMRHAVAHERSDASAKDAEFVLNTAQQLLFASEQWKIGGSAT